MIANEIDSPVISLSKRVLAVSIILGVLNIALFFYFSTKHLQPELERALEPKLKTVQLAMLQKPEPPVKHNPVKTVVNPALKTYSAVVEKLQSNSSAMTESTPGNTEINRMNKEFESRELDYQVRSFNTLARHRTNDRVRWLAGNFIAQNIPGSKDDIGTQKKGGPSKGPGNSNGSQNNLSEVTELDHPVRWIYQIPPEYPRQMLDRDIKAEIDIRYILEANGTVSNVEYLTKNVPPAFQKSIVNALVKWKSEPPTIKGVPTRIKLLQRMIFTIPE